MEKRLLLAFVLSAAILLAWSVLFPPPQRAPQPTDTPVPQTQVSPDEQEDDPEVVAADLPGVDERTPPETCRRGRRRFGRGNRYAGERCHQGGAVEPWRRGDLVSASRIRRRRRRAARSGPDGTLAGGCETSPADHRNGTGCGPLCARSGSMEGRSSDGPTGAAARYRKGLPWRETATDSMSKSRQLVL